MAVKGAGTVSNRRGFTLVELIMIIVVVGIVLPVILSPFFQSAREITTPANISALTMAAKGNMEIELDDLCASTGPNWPSERTTSPGAYQKTIPANTTANINGVSYISSSGTLNFTTTIVGTFYLSDLATVTDGTADGIFGGVIGTDDLYLLIDVTTTISGTGDSVTVQTVKSKDYLKSKCP